MRALNYAISDLKFDKEFILECVKHGQRFLNNSDYYYFLNDKEFINDINKIKY